jgi:hypothetical protein
VTCFPSATGRPSWPRSAGRGRHSPTRPWPSSDSSGWPASSSGPGPTPPARLREGLDDTLTLTRLGITGPLAKTLCSTNPCESMIEIVRYTQRNVKRWRDGDMRKRWTAAGMLVAEQQFRRIIGYRDLAKLVIAIERHADRVKLANANTVTITHTQVSEVVTV